LLKNLTVQNESGRVVKGFPSNIYFSRQRSVELGLHFSDFHPWEQEQENTKIESIGDKP